MTQNLVSQVVSSLSSILIEVLTLFSIENYGLKVDIILKISVNISNFFVCDLWAQTVLISSDQNISIP